jgi:hypothetical protein
MSGSHLRVPIRAAIVTTILVGMLAGCSSASTQPSTVFSPSPTGGGLTLDPGWTKVWEGGSDRSDISSSLRASIVITMNKARLKWSIDAIRANPFGGPPGPKLFVILRTNDLFGRFSSTRTSPQ